MKSTPKKLHALVVDDHPLSRKVLGFMLAKLGCKVTFCENGQQSVEHVQQRAFDIIFIDVSMPVMDGLTATRIIREIQSASLTVPIILVSADVVTENRDMAILAGANDFIAKPLHIETLRELMQKHISA